MRSISLEMLRLADKMPACPADQNDFPNNELDSLPDGTLYTHYQQHEDSIPTEVRRHISNHLSSQSAPTLPASTLLTTISSNAYINQRTKLLSRTLLPGSPSDFPQVNTATSILDLPRELLSLIGEHLSPADMICLGLTCKQLFLAADYHLVDLKNLEFAGGDLGQLFDDHHLFEPLARERYDVRHRLDRDRIVKLERIETHAWLTCRTCVEMHPRRYFSTSERSAPAGQRACSASSAPLQICPHWNESHSSLFVRSERSACDPLYRSRHRAEACQHHDHGKDTWSAPSLLDLGNSTYSISRTMMILRTNNQSSTFRPSVSESLRSEVFRDTGLCPHIRLSDEVVIESFKRSARFETMHSPNIVRESDEHDEQFAGISAFEPASCERCGRTWQFSIMDYSGLETSQPRWNIMLIVDDQIKVPRNPWTREYLQNVNGGEDLIRLMVDG